jgi:hypothetical protein
MLLYANPLHAGHDGRHLGCGRDRRGLVATARALRQPGGPR